MTNHRNIMLVFTLVLCLSLLCLFFNSEFMPLSKRILKSFKFDDDSSSLENNGSSALNKVLRNSSNPVRNVTILRLVVIISTAPHRSARRDAIRKTYWRYCYNNSQVRSKYNYWCARQSCSIEQALEEIKKSLFPLNLSFRSVLTTNGIVDTPVTWRYFRIIVRHLYDAAN